MKLDLLQGAQVEFMLDLLKSHAEKNCRVKIKDQRIKMKTIFIFTLAAGIRT